MLLLSFLDVDNLTHPQNVVGLWSVSSVVSGALFLRVDSGGEDPPFTLSQPLDLIEPVKEKCFLGSILQILGKRWVGPTARASGAWGMQLLAWAVICHTCHLHFSLQTGTFCASIR